MKKKILLPQIKPFSPEQQFIRTGKLPADLNEARAKRLGTRLLSRVWFNEAKKREAVGKSQLSLPSFRQRLRKGNLSKADVSLIREQTAFAINKFASHLSRQKRAIVTAKVNELMSSRILSINLALREKTNSDLRQMRVQGMELMTKLRNEGEMHIGLMQDKSGKVYFAKGWGNKKSEKGIALHEAMHVLQKLGVIKVDVPFAETARWLYCLENGIYSPNAKFRMPTATEFDRKALPEKNDSMLLYEAQWSYNLGDRIAEWLYKNVPEKKRWNYLRLRCNNVNHADALKKIGFKIRAVA